MLITVYITNYNYGQYIEQSIESLLNQTFQDFEVIIIDDGSTDNSREIIARYADYKNIRTIYQQNKGLNVTNNIALRASKGKYIMRLDADDYLDPNALLVMSKALEDNDELGLVFPDYYMVDKDGNIMNVEQRHSFNNEVSLFDQPAHGACTMIRTDFLKEVGGYDEQYKCQDGYELWIKFATKYKVSNVNIPLFYYRQHGSNLTSNEDRILSTRLKIKENYIKQHKDEHPNVLTIVPVRDMNAIGFQKIKGEFLFDILLKKTLLTKQTGIIVISSPDAEVKEHFKKHYADNKRVLYHKREKSLSRLNATLDATVSSVLETETITAYSPEYILVLSPEFPLVRHRSFEDAINTMRIFESDSLLSVRLENGIFYRHEGSGMVPILNQDKFTKLEREALYRNVGGILTCSVKSFKKTGKILNGKVGHIVIGQREAIHANSDLNLKLINFLMSEETAFAEAIVK